VTNDGGYRFSWESVNAGELALLPAGPGFWVFVTGGGLPCEIALRIHRHADGRYGFSGLSIADALPSPLEVTTQLLRQIKLGEIQAALFGPDALHAFDPGQPDAGETPSPEAARYLADLLAAHDQSVSGPSRRPEETELQAFARTYETELNRQPRRAMTAAAKSHNISRATANRWAALCRQYGYLPATAADDSSL
jgi:hypothetical protein